MVAVLLVISLQAMSLASGSVPTVEVRQLTFGPKHHFFGYIGHVGTIPWNQSGRYIVALETAFQDRMPTPDDAADIILLDTQQGYAIRKVDETRAWNPQQGTMLYWNPQNPQTQFFFNDRDPATDKVFCVLFDLARESGGRRVREYRFEDTPVGNSGVAQQGGHFAAINYGRLARLRPVTGYPHAFNFTEGVEHPDNDGVFRVDVQTGQKRLIVSFRQIAELIRPVRPDVDRMGLFINHTLWNRENDRLFFFARGDFETDQRLDIPFVVRPDGGGLTMLSGHFGGHPEWAEGHLMIGRQGNHQAIYDTDRQVFAGFLGDTKVFPNPGGDIALSPDGRWLVNGSDRKGENSYVFFRRADGVHVRSPGVKRGGWTSGELRLDPAPCWNRDGTQILVPGIADDPGHTRQLFVIRLRM